MNTTLYGVLGVEPSADERDVVRAYREKVKTHHPDVSDAPDAREAFKRIRTAKAVLTDSDERARYDSLGHETYVRRHLDAGRWGVSAAPTASRAASSVADSATTTESASAGGGSAGQRQYTTDGGTAAAYYRPGERVGVDSEAPVRRLSAVLLDVGPLLLGHFLLLLSSAVMAGWLLTSASGGTPSLTSAVVAAVMLGITGCLSLLHLTTTVYR